MRTTAKMGLTSWDQPTDLYNYAQLAGNWQTVDYHDHSPGRGTPIAAGGLAPGAVLTNSIAQGVVGLQHLSGTVLQDLGLNYGTSLGRGTSIVSGTNTVTSTTYAAAGTPDQVQNVVIGANGLLAIAFQATWSETVSGAGRAAIFIGGTQLHSAVNNQNTPATQAAATNSGTAAILRPLSTCPLGLVSATTAAYSGDTTTGQIIGIGNNTGGLGMDYNGSPFALPNNQGMGGWAFVFAAAGTYTVSVQYKSSSGSVSVSGRKLWVRTENYL